MRQALDFATPSQDIIDKLLKGRAVRSAWPTSAGHLGIQPEHRGAALRYRAGQGAAGRGRADPGRGRRLGRQGADGRSRSARWRGQDRWRSRSGPSPATPRTQQIIQIIAQSLEQLGVKTTTHLPGYLHDLGTRRATSAPDTMTACIYSWSNGNDPDDMFYWHSEQIPADPDRHRRQRYLPISTIQLPGGDRRADRGGRRRDRPGGAQGDLLADPGTAARAGAGDLHLLGQGVPGAANKMGGFWPSAFNRLLWNVQEWYMV